MATCAAAIFGQILIIVLRSTAAGPAVSSWYWDFSSAPVPPMLVPIATPVRRGSSSGRPACASAWAAAASVNKVNWSLPETTAGSAHRAGAKSRTPDQNAGTSWPRAEIMPVPVITTSGIGVLLYGRGPWSAVIGGGQVQARLHTLAVNLVVAQLGQRPRPSRHVPRHLEPSQPGGAERAQPGHIRRPGPGHDRARLLDEHRVRDRDHDGLGHPAIGGDHPFHLVRG